MTTEESRDQTARRSSRDVRVRARTLAPLALAALLGGAWLVPRAGEPTVERREDAGAQPCFGGRWSDPRTVADLPPGTFLRSPTIALEGRELYVAGLPSPAGPPRDGTGPGAADLVVRHESRGSIGLPAGSFRFLNARLLRGRGGRLHLVWGESNATSRQASSASLVPPARVGRLWHATFVPGNGWSPARPIWSSDAARDASFWNSESADASVSASGELDVVVPQLDGGLLHLTLQGNRWREETLPVRALYATIARARNGTLHVAYLGEDPARRGQMSGLLLLSRTGDAPWSEPVALPSRVVRSASRPRFLTDSRGTLHLLWGISSPGRLGSVWLRHLASTDGGEHWSAAHDLELPHEQFTKWRAGIDRCGAPRVLVSTWVSSGAGRSGRVLQSMLGDSRWTPLAPLFGDRGAREIEVGDDGRGDLYVVASVRRSTVDTSRASYQVAVSEFVGPVTTAKR
jgi:hypothetical protein